MAARVRLFTSLLALCLNPIFHPFQDASAVTVYFPGTQPWYDLKSGQAYGLPGQSRTVSLAVQLATVPAFMRAGSIIPRKDRLRRSSSQMRMDPYTLVSAYSLSNVRCYVTQLGWRFGSFFNFILIPKKSGHEVRVSYDGKFLPY